MFAQDTTGIKIGGYQLNGFSITSGKGALTSGLDTKFDFSNQRKWVVSIQANSDRATINIGKKWKHFQVLESFGVYKNMIWTGPMLLANFGPLDLIAWNGICLSKSSELKETGFNPNFLLSYEGAGLTFWKNNRIGGAVLWFGQAPMNWFISYKRTIPLGDKSRFFVEATYNHTLDIPMFVIGYSMKLQ
jgi:hypothetical protein